MSGTKNEGGTTTYPCGCTETVTASGNIDIVHWENLCLLHRWSECEWCAYVQVGPVRTEKNCCDSPDGQHHLVTL